MKYIKLLLFTLILFSCKSSKKTIISESRVSNKHKVIAWYDENEKDIWAFSIPIYLRIENTSMLSPEIFISHKYIYKDKKSGTHTFLYELNKNGELEKQKNYTKKSINPSSQKEYIIYTKHLINDIKLSEKIMVTFKNKEFKKDSIALDFFDGFKKKLPNLAEKILVQDSLFLSFKNKDKTSKLSSKRIKIPVKIQ